MHRLNVYSALLYLLIVSPLLSAGVNEWSGNGPFGGNISTNSLTIHPTDPNVIYAKSCCDVYRTGDGGTNWSNITQSFATGSNIVFNQVAVDTVNPDNVYVAGTILGSRIQKSIDAGITWSSAETGLTIQPAFLVTHPSVTGTLFAADTNGVFFKSQNAGGTWSPLGTVPALQRFSGFAIAPSNPQVLYGWGQEGVFLSSDGGVNWNLVNDGLVGYQGGTDLGVDTLAIDPANADRAYAKIRNSDLFVTTDRGANWAEADTVVGLPNDFFRALVIDPGTTSTLYIATGNNEVLKSTDSGSSWQAADSGINQSEVMNDLVISAGDPGVLYVASTGTGVYRTGDAGAAWTTAANGIATSSIQDLALQPGSGRVFSGSRYSNTIAHYSDDNGGSWTSTAAEVINERNGWSIAADPLTPSTLYLGGSADVYKSSDNGVSWEDLNVGVFGQFEEILIHPQNPSIVYAMSTNNNIVKTTDGGSSWNTANNGLPNGGDPNTQALAMAPSSPDVLFTASSFSGQRGIYKSIDGGANWLESNGGDVTSDTFVRAIAVDPTDPSRVYAASNSSPPGIFKSTDGGATWSQVISSGAWSLFIDPDNHNTLYAGVGSLLYRSVDAGLTWSAMPPPNRQGLISSVITGPSGSNRIFAGSTSQAVLTMQLATDLSVSLIASAAAIPVGQDLTYLLEVENLGPMGEPAVELQFNLPIGVSLQSATPDQGDPCSNAAGILTCNLGGLNSGDTAGVEVVVSVDAAGTLTGSATGSGSLIELDTVSNTTDIEVLGQPDNDGDGIVDDSDPDDDNDTVTDDNDNCPFVTNPEQENFDGDAAGDVCDPDDDNDEITDQDELDNGLNPMLAADALEDNDSDDLINREEIRNGTDLNDPDSDDDGVNDGPEVSEGRNPLVNESSVLIFIFNAME
ncbi:MAG: hypothetical protein GY703_20330 [Gammaproteobacteria bacterium]|nr:hypothetical protein [Gammaproteobacteria bacterium]